MQSICVPALDAQIPQATDFIRQCLARYKVKSKALGQAVLLAEEALVSLNRHAPQGAHVQIALVKRMGGVSVRLSAPGQAFQLDQAMDLGLDMDLDQEGGEAESAIRGLLFNAYRDKLRYKHHGGRSTVLIIAQPAQRRLIYLTLGALALAVVLGLILRAVLSPGAAGALDQYALTPIKTMFLNALKMVVAPVAFFSILSCVSQFSSLSELGKTGAKVMGLYMATTLAAIAVGAGVYFLCQPGSGVEPLAAQAAQAAQSLSAQDAQVDVLGTIVNIVPDNLVRPFLEADMLQVIFVAILCGAAVGMIGDYSKPLKDFFEACNTLFLKITTIIVGFIPLAVFCSVCSLVMLTGGQTLASLVGFLASVLLGMACMVALYCLLLLAVGRLDPRIFLRKYAPSMLTTFSLGSSNAAVPYTMQVCRDELGVSPKVCAFSIPLGATVNMDGTCVYLVVAALFLARVYGVAVAPSDLAGMFFSVLVLSVGAPGIPGSGLVCLCVLLVQMGVPVEAAGLIMGVDSIVGMFRAASNTTGDVAVSLIVAKLDRLLDLAVYNRKKAA